jgi:hypothetical protein
MQVAAAVGGVKDIGSLKITFRQPEPPDAAEEERPHVPGEPRRLTKEDITNVNKAIRANELKRAAEAYKAKAEGPGRFPKGARRQ